MDRVTLGRTGLNVCKNGFGALPIQRISYEEAAKLLVKAYQNGIEEASVFRMPEHAMGGSGRLRHWQRDFCFVIPIV